MLLVSVTLEERTGRAEAQLLELEERRKIRNAFFPTHLSIIESAARAYVNASVAVFAQDSSDEDVAMGDEALPPVSPVAVDDDARAMIHTIFKIFDTNSDGLWDMTEMNQWMEVLEESSFDANDWEASCNVAGVDPGVGFGVGTLEEWYQTTEGSLHRHYSAILSENGPDSSVAVLSEAKIHKLDTMLDIIFKGFDSQQLGYWDEDVCQNWLDTVGWLDTYEEMCDACGANPDAGLNKDHVTLLYNINEYRLTKHYEEMAKQRPEDNTFNAADDENEADYCVGGYHRVAIHDVYNNRWEVVRKLGWGNFSTVWLAKDKLGGRPVALKIGKGAETSQEMSELEVQVLRETNNYYARCESEILKECAKRLVRLDDYFDIEGPHGIHPTMAIEAVGPDILKLITAHDFAGVAPCITKTLVKHMLGGLAFLHSMGLAHADIKPENVLIQTLDANGDCDPTRLEQLLGGTIEKPEGMSLAEFMDATYSCKVSDFGSSKWVEKDKSVHKMQTLEYRAPEVVLGYSADVAIDVWSVACTCFELLTGSFLFNPKAFESSVPQDAMHVALFMETLGPFPKAFSCGSGWHCQEYFDENGDFKYGHVDEVDLADTLVEKHATREQAEQLVDFLMPMLELNPNMRVSALEAMQHPWLTVTEEDHIPFTREGRQRLGIKRKGEIIDSSSESCSSETLPSPEDYVMEVDDEVPPPPEKSPVTAPSTATSSIPSKISKDTVIIDLRQRADYADLRREELVERRRLRTQFFPIHLEAIKESARARA